MKSLLKIKALMWPSVATLMILVSVTLFGLCLSDGHSESAYLKQSACDSVTTVEHELQEDGTDYMADSVEFSGCISKSKNNSKLLHKVLVPFGTQYKPPFMEKEQRPPQSSLV